MKYFLYLYFILLSSCVPPEEEQESTFYEDSSTRQALKNLKDNQDSPLSSRSRVPDYLSSSSESYSTIKKPDLAGRWYLFNLFDSIYTQSLSTKSPSNEEILRSSLLKNVNVFGSACDPNEVIAKGSTQASTEISNPDSKCDNRDFWDPMRRDTSILRNGWKISMCGQLNQGFSYTDRPLDLLKQLYFYGAANSTPEVDVNEKSIKIAYHLFNRYHTPPVELLTSLLKIDNLDRQSLGIDPEKYSIDEEGVELNSNETKNIKKWRRIFYLLCIDPNNEII